MVQQEDVQAQGSWAQGTVFRDYVLKRKRGKEKWKEAGDVAQQYSSCLANVMS